jgi:EpsI family protein
VIWLLARLSGRRGRLGDLLQTELLWPPRRRPAAAAPSPSSPPAAVVAASPPAIAVVALLVAAAAGMLALPGRAEEVPARPQGFATFPLRLGEWRGTERALDQVYIDVLKFDDYLLADYTRPGDAEPVQLYAAYYGSQRKGASVHSPRSCIPGGGWEITRMEQVTLRGAGPAGGDLPVNRVLIANGPYRQLVYYWFDQRGRRMTNEYHVKLMLFWDALTRNRTDGALVRVVTTLPPNSDAAAADRRLDDFVRAAYPRLVPLLPS